MFCKECGAEIPNDAKFCSKCGSSASVETPVAAPTAEPQEQAAPQTSGEPEWFFYEGADKRGPYSYIQMVEFVKQGKIQRETLVWTKEFSDWMAAEQSPLGQVLGNVAPVAPIGMISDKWMWALATIPWVVDQISTILAFRFFGDGALTQWLPVICTIAANIYFATKDMDEIKKSGRDVEQWMYTGFILVFIYLFVRASKTSKNYIPAILNIVLSFAPSLL